MTSVIPVGRSLYDEDHELLRDTVRAFVDKHAAPHAERWRAGGKVDRELFEEAARAGILVSPSPRSTAVAASPITASTR
jgi:alkylation response protein AidB-like acyl-CoA dehydrogenase